MSSDLLSIRTMRAEELGLAADWAAAEGWNPGLTDMAAFHAADPDSFLIGELAGEPAALISATRYEGGFGFMGFYIVPSHLRGRGYGMQIWRAAAVRLAGYNVGLDGVLAQEDNYRRSGFRLAYRNVRYQAAAWTAGMPAGLSQVSSHPIAAVEAHDRLHFPAPRPAFLRHWLSAEGTTALAVARDGVITGYGVIRPCRIGYKIGPLFAGNASIAESLLHGLIASVPPGAEVNLDVPTPNLEAVRLAESHDMRPVFETVRMYTGVPPALPLSQIFGVTSFELG